MQKVGWNIPGADYYMAGKAIPGSNNYLESPPISVQTIPSGWSSVEIINIYYPNYFSYDHIHFSFGSSIPTKEELAFAEYTRSRTITVFLPDGESYIYILPHTETHSPKGYDTDIGVIGPFQIDTFPPSGSIRIGGGVWKVLNSNSSIEVSATDDYSGVDKMYIDGDIEDGDEIRTWIDYITTHDIVLTESIGQKIVSIKFKDEAGNESSIYRDDIIFGNTKYLFYKTDVPQNNLENSLIGQFNIQTNNIITESNNKLSEGDEHGKLGSY